MEAGGGERRWVDLAGFVEETEERKGGGERLKNRLVHGIEVVTKGLTNDAKTTDQA